MEKSFRNHPISNCWINFLLVLMYAREYWMKKLFFSLSPLGARQENSKWPQIDQNIIDHFLAFLSRAEHGGEWGMKKKCCKAIDEIEFFLCASLLSSATSSSSIGNHFSTRKIGESFPFFLDLIVSMRRMLLRYGWCGGVDFLNSN